MYWFKLFSFSCVLYSPSFNIFTLTLLVLNIILLYSSWYFLILSAVLLFFNPSVKAFIFIRFSTSLSLLFKIVLSSLGFGFSFTFSILFKTLKLFFMLSNSLMYWFILVSFSEVLSSPSFDILTLTEFKFDNILLYSSLYFLRLSSVLSFFKFSVNSSPFTSSSTSLSLLFKLVLSNFSFCSGFTCGFNDLKIIFPSSTFVSVCIPDTVIFFLKWPPIHSFSIYVLPLFPVASA